MKTRTTRSFRSGFTLLEILIVVGILALIMALAIPNLFRARSTAQRKLCIKNLSQIESAKQTWALEAGKGPGATPTDAELFGANGYIKVRPTCPTGGDYTLNPVGTTATCPNEGHTF